jgi:hypothetical protein
MLPTGSDDSVRVPGVLICVSRDIQALIKKLVAIFAEDGILKRLKECQRWLDPTDSTEVLEVYERLKSKHSQLEDEIDLWMVRDVIASDTDDGDPRSICSPRQHRGFPLGEDRSGMILLEKFMLAATLKDCSICITLGFDKEVSIRLIDLDQKSAHNLRSMCLLHEDIRSEFKQSGLRRACCYPCRDSGIQE